MRVIGNSWDEVLAEEFNKEYFKRLESQVLIDFEIDTVYPPMEHIFKSLEMVEFDDIKVVILGQDPYHGKNQANGIAFAVNDGIALPPSLKNIITEIESDLNIKREGSANLLGLAAQGVLLLNSSLTVLSARPQSHSNIGWQTFTDAIINKCAQRQKSMVFMLWGASAIAKKSLINPRHLALCAPHPSPLSAYRGFFGCKHFSKANSFLQAHSMPPIDWSK